MKLLSNIHLLVPTRYRNKILASSKDKIPLLHITEFLQRQKGQRQRVAVRIYSGKSKRLLPQRSRIYTEKELGMKLRRQLPRWKSHYQTAANRRWAVAQKTVKNQHQECRVSLWFRKLLRALHNGRPSLSTPGRSTASTCLVRTPPTFLSRLHVNAPFRCQTDVKHPA